MSYVTESYTTESTTLAPFEIWEVMLDDSTIKFYEPLAIKPRILDQGTSGECFYAEYPELDVSAVGVDLDELLSCLRSDIRMNWKRIVQKRTNELSVHEQRIKQRWLEIAEEINDG